MSDSTTDLTIQEKNGPGSSRLLPNPDSNNIIFFSGIDNQEVMRITPDGRLVKGPGLSDDTASLLFFDSCKKVFGNAADELRDLRAARAEADDLRKYLNEEISTNSELGDELLAERATFAEFRNHAWDEQKKLRTQIAQLESARYKYQDDPEMVFDEELGWVHVMVQQEFKDLRAELADLKEAGLFLLHHAQEANPRCRGDAKGFQSAIDWMKRALKGFGLPPSEETEK